MNKNIIICESFKAPLQRVFENEEQRQEYIFEGVCADFTGKNENGRTYDREEYLSFVNGILAQEIADCHLAGSLDHPDDDENEEVDIFTPRMKDLSHLVTALWFDEETNQVRCRIKLLDTRWGKDAKACADAGMPIYISSRSSGYIDPDGLVHLSMIYTYDIVYRPGFKQAKLARVLESKENDVSFMKVFENEPKRLYNVVYDYETTTYVVLPSDTPLKDSQEKVGEPFNTELEAERSLKDTREFTPDPEKSKKYTIMEQNYVKVSDFNTFARRVDESLMKLLKVNENWQDNARQQFAQFFKIDADALSGFAFDGSDDIEQMATELKQENVQSLKLVYDDTVSRAKPTETTKEKSEVQEKICEGLRRKIRAVMESVVDGLDEFNVEQPDALLSALSGDEVELDDINVEKQEDGNVVITKDDKSLEVTPDDIAEIDRCLQSDHVTQSVEVKLAERGLLSGEASTEDKFETLKLLEPFGLVTELNEESPEQSIAAYIRSFDTARYSKDLDGIKQQIDELYNFSIDGFSMEDKRFSSITSYLDAVATSINGITTVIEANQAAQTERQKALEEALSMTQRRLNTVTEYAETIAQTVNSLIDNISQGTLRLNSLIEYADAQSTFSNDVADRVDSLTEIVQEGFKQKRSTVRVSPETQNINEKLNGLISRLTNKPLPTRPNIVKTRVFEADGTLVVPSKYEKIWEALPEARRQEITSVFELRQPRTTIEAEVLWESFELGKTPKKLFEGTAPARAVITEYTDKDIDRLLGL